MRDGLYQVTTSYLCAGFVVENGRVTDCAPILRKRLAYWRTIARRIDLMHRVLVTGSRTWTDAETIRRALHAMGREYGKETILVSGACPQGADRIAETIWSGWGGQIERHPANWSQHGRSAGFVRNAAMVEAGADVCLAFIRAGSRGASHTARLAETAGIPTQRFEQWDAGESPRRTSTVTHPKMR